MKLKVLSTSHALCSAAWPNELHHSRKWLRQLQFRQYSDLDKLGSSNSVEVKSSFVDAGVG